MMLPEHVKLLKEYDLNQSKKMKPEIDEQLLELFEETICEAMAGDSYLSFTYFKHEDFHLLIGKVHYIDTYKRELRIMDYHNELHRLLLDDLIDVRVH